MKKAKAKNTIVTLEWEDIRYVDGKKVVEPQIQQNEINFNYQTKASDLVHEFHSKVKDTEPYRNLFEFYRVETTIGEKLAICQIIMSELVSTDVKYHTKSSNPKKRDFRLSMTMLAKLSKYAKLLSLGKEYKEETTSKKTNKTNQKPNILNKLTSIWK